MAFNLADYEEVKDRIPRFLEQHPDGRILTSLESPVAELGVVVFRATLYKTGEDQEKGLPLSTGWAFEKEGAGTVNKTSHLENCETSAIGRALANVGIQGKQRPSREDMRKVEEPQVTRPAERTNGNQLDAKRKAFFANAQKLGVDGEDAKALVKSMFELDSFNDATLEQLRSAYERLRDEAKVQL
jgi:hypothetical protein